MEIFFILVEPAVPENIGASARALKTMGFTKLRLVNPVDFHQGKAQWVAHGSREILEKAEIYNDFDSSINDLDFIIGTTSKRRRTNYDYYYPGHLKKLIENKQNTVNKIGIVFGREESGLSNDEIRKCDLVSTIRMVDPYPSLNLSQAVMLYAYELSDLQNIKRKVSGKGKNESLHALKKKISRILDIMEINRKVNIAPRIMERIMMLGDDDIHLIHSFCNNFLEKYDKAES